MIKGITEILNESTNYKDEFIEKLEKLIDSYRKNISNDIILKILENQVSNFKMWMKK